MLFTGIGLQKQLRGGGVTKREMRCFGLVMVTDEIVKLSCRIDSSWVVLLVFTF